jgi:hypothetical protein
MLTGASETDDNSRRAIIATVTGATLRCLRQVARLLMTTEEAWRECATSITNQFTGPLLTTPEAICADEVAAAAVLARCENNRLRAAHAITQATRSQIAAYLKRQPASEHGLALTDTLRYVSFSTGVAEAGGAVSAAAAAFKRFVDAEGTLYLKQCIICGERRVPTEFARLACGHFVCIADFKNQPTCLLNVHLQAGSKCPLCQAVFQGPRSIIGVVTSTSDLEKPDARAGDEAHARTFLVNADKSMSKAYRTLQMSERIAERVKAIYGRASPVEVGQRTSDRIGAFRAQLADAVSDAKLQYTEMIQLKGAVAQMLQTGNLEDRASRVARFNACADHIGSLPHRLRSMQITFEATLLS